jgi:transcription antitermination factor NusG
MPLLPKETEIHPETIFELNEPWRVAHVRSRQEKLLARHLLEGDVPFYLPQVEKSVSRAGRRFVSYVPLFAGYVFFRGEREARQRALRSNVVASLIEVQDQAGLDSELKQIRQLQLMGASLIPLPEFAAGDTVRVTEGAFAGYRGIVVRAAKRDRLLVSISLLRKTVAVEFPLTAMQRQRR